MKVVLYCPRRCIMFLLFLVVCGVIALVIVKVINPNKHAIQAAAATVGVNTTDWTHQISNGVNTAVTTVTNGATNAVSGRKLLHLRELRQTLQCK